MRRRDQILRSADGFTLTELILSVCVMAIVSVYMLQFFISAKDLNTRSADLDQSVFLSSTIVELMKSDLWSESQLCSRFISEQESDNTIVYKGFYNKTWDFAKGDSKEALFQVTVRRNVDDKGFNQKNLNHIFIEVKRNSPYYRGKSDQPILYSLDTFLYVQNPKEVLGR